MLEEKKSLKANLDKQKFTFVLLGLVLSFAVFYVAFEWTAKEITIYEQDYNEDVAFEEEMIEQTVPEEQVTPPPPEVPDVIEDLNIVEDDVETADIDISSEDDQNKQQEVIQAPVVIEEEEVEEDPVFAVVEKMPEFPGGQAKLMRYLNENIKYPIIAQENGIQGRVIVQFTVRRDGAIDEVQVVRSADPSLDKEAIRLVKSMPNWTPGKQRGKAVSCKYFIPVVFKLQM